MEPGFLFLLFAIGLASIFALTLFSVTLITHEPNVKRAATHSPSATNNSDGRGAAGTMRS
jgi:hypothetical protein